MHVGVCGGGMSVLCHVTFNAHNCRLSMELELMGAAGETVQRLPAAHTCYFKLDLPRYTSEEVRCLCEERKLTHAH